MGRRDTVPMKTNHRFNGSWFMVALLAAVVIGELVATQLTRHFGFRASPIVVAFLSAGIAAAFASVIYHDADIA
jgi:hypothetical protein